MTIKHDYIIWNDQPIRRHAIAFMFTTSSTGIGIRLIVSIWHSNYSYYESKDILIYWDLLFVLGLTRSENLSYGVTRD